MRFSDIISNTIDSDVIIVDNNFEVVGTAFRYFTLYNGIEVGSLISEVISTKNKVIVKDKNTIPSCRKCEKFDTCKMVGFVGIPIYYNNYVVGAIALILPQHRVDSIFLKIDTFTEFLENMAELLSGKIKEVNHNHSLNQIIVEREAMMDLLSEAVVFTDYFGNIQHANKAFCRLFPVKQNYIGKQLQELIPHALFQEYFQEHKEFKNIRLYFSWGASSFYGFVSSKEVKINGKDYGTMFALQTVKQVLRNAQLSEKGSLVTLSWAEWVFSRDIIRKAKALAVTNKIVLIHSNHRNLSELLAKGIANYSERSLKGLKMLYCDNVYRDLMSIFLFDEFGELRDANEGTMFIQDVENLPIYIQEQLLNFIKTGKIPLNNNMYVQSDVRLIFATTKNLKKLVGQGLFLEDLYYHIIENEIEVSNVQDDFMIYQHILETGLNYYAKVYHKNKLSLTDDVINYLYKSVYKDDLNYFESVIEMMVRHNDKQITIQELRDMSLYVETKKEDLSLSGLEKDIISELLKKGCSKTEIAKRLGIGRATLYRRLEDYGLYN